MSDLAFSSPVKLVDPREQLDLDISRWQREGVQRSMDKAAQQQKGFAFTPPGSK